MSLFGYFSRKCKLQKVLRLRIYDLLFAVRKISAFVDTFLQPIMKEQQSYIKDTTRFINFIEGTRVPQNAIVVSMDVTSLYTNIPQEEGITTICHAYETFYTATPPIPTHYLKEMPRLILQENSFQFNGKNFLQTHGTAMGTKTAVSFANIFMAKIETAIIDQHSAKPLVWKRYIDDMFSLWDTNREEINNFIEHANNYHPTIKFIADISDKEIIFPDTCIYKGARFKNKNLFLTHVLILSLLKHSSTRTLNPVTHLESKKAS